MRSTSRDEWPITRRSPSRRVQSRAAILALVALSIGLASPLLYGQQAPLDSKTLARHLEAIEEKEPYHLRDLMRNGRPTLIAFVDHLCFTCLRSVESIEKLRSRFSDRANIAVIDPSRITAAHTWAKDRYRVWFVPKFVIVDKGGDIASEYFGPTLARTLASNLNALLTK